MIHQQPIVFYIICDHITIVMFNDASLFKGSLVAMTGLAKALEYVQQERFAAHYIPREQMVYVLG